VAKFVNCKKEDESNRIELQWRQQRNANRHMHMGYPYHFKHLFICDSWTWKCTHDTRKNSPKWRIFKDVDWTQWNF